MLKPGVLCDYCGQPIGREEIENGEAVKLGAECFCGECVRKHDLLDRGDASGSPAAGSSSANPPVASSSGPLAPAIGAPPSAVGPRAGVRSPPASGRAASTGRNPAGAMRTAAISGNPSAARPSAGREDRQGEARRPTGKARVPSAVARAPTARVVEAADFRPRAARTVREVPQPEDARGGIGRASGKSGGSAATKGRLLLLLTGAVLGCVIIAAAAYFGGGACGGGTGDRNGAARAKKGDAVRPDGRGGQPASPNRPGGTSGSAGRAAAATSPAATTPASNMPREVASPTAGTPDAGKPDAGKPDSGRPAAGAAGAPRPGSRHAETPLVERYVPKRREGEEELKVKDDVALSEGEKISRDRARAAAGNAATGGCILLSSFEKDEDFRLWGYKSVRPFRGRAGVGDGNSSLRLEPEPSAEDPKALCSAGIDLGPDAAWDWSKGGLLRFDACNDSGGPLDLFVTLKWRTKDGVEKYSFKFTLERGIRHELSALLSEASNDLGKVCGIEFSFPRGDAEHPRVLYLDRIRVETKAE